MSYNASTGIISAPVSIRDVQRALGHSSADLGTLIANGNINIWAKFKPVSNTSVQYMSQWNATSKHWLSGASWFHGIGAAWRYGLSPWVRTVDGSYSSLSALITAYTSSSNHMNGWSYHRPTGGSTSPYRLTDFADYCANARSIADGFQVGSPVGINSQTNVGTLVASFAYAPDDDYNVTPENLLGVDTYFGVALAYNGTVVLYGTVDNAGGMTIQKEVRFPSGAEGKTYNVYPFLATRRQGFDDRLATITLYTIPLLQPTTLTVASQSQLIGVTISGEYTSSAKTAATITITVDSNLNYYNNYIELTSGNNTYNVNVVWNGTTGRGSIGTGTTFSLLAGTTYTINMTGLDATKNYLGLLHVNGSLTDYKRFGIMENIVE